MTLAVGTRLGSFEITGLLGKGGMGEVYRATDLKLGRDVAIKVLPEVVAGDPEHLGRFRKEAKTLASLDHPNIGAVYEFREEEVSVGAPKNGDSPVSSPSSPEEATVESPGLGQSPILVHFLVMQLVEGDTLSDRIRRGRMSVREALPIFVQIARGLDAAHAAGIVHRDLKPANVKISPRGEVKVLDFGIAKDVANADIDPNAPTTPMTSSPVTGEGLLVGTPQYMSPEQARGKPVDRRTDVWAFGCCLYEALTGSMPFNGETLTDVVSEIIQRDPDWSKLPSLPPRVESVLRRSLEKDQHRRLSSLGDIAILLEEAQDQIRKGTHAATESKPDYVRTGASIFIVFGLILGAFLAGLREREGEAIPTAGSTGPVIASLAVLPLRNLSPRGEQDYFAESMTEAITAELGQIKALNIRGRSSAMQYKDTELGIPEIAGALNVDALIEGTVTREGDDVRISVTLQHGSSDTQLWSGRYEETITSVLKLQSDVALAIAEAVSTEITGEERQRIETVRSVDPAAHEAYVLGQKLYVQQTKSSLHEAARQFGRAIELDPGFVPAYVGLARTHLNATEYNFASAKSSAEGSLANARRAVELDDTHPGAQSILATAVWNFEHDWKAAEAGFQRSIELDPNNADTRMNYSIILALVGDWREAKRQAKLALELDSTSYNIRLRVAWAQLLVREYDTSIRMFESVLEDDPSGALAIEGIGYAHLQKQNYVEALQYFEQLPVLRDNDYDARIRLGVGYAVAGRVDDARVILDAVAADAAAPDMPLVNLAELAAWTGDFDTAMRWLEAARVNRLSELTWTLSGVIGTVFHDDPRFWAMYDEMGLPDAPVGHPAYAKQRQFQIEQAAAEMLREAGGPQLLERIAVLPFENYSGDAEQAYFVNGMTDALTAELQKISNLVVISSSATRGYRDTDKSLKDIARELGVDGLITGSVFRAGNDIRITAELTDPDSLGSLWSETYDDTMENVIKVQGQATLAIADAIRVAVTDEEQKRIAREKAVDPEAYDLYLKGKEAYLTYTEEGYPRAVSLLSEAVEIDQNFVEPYAWLSYALWVGTVWGSGGDAEAFEKARHAAQRALEIDPDAAPGHYAMGWIHATRDFDWRRAEEHFLRAAELSPNDPEVYNGLMRSYARVGRFSDALKASERLAELDPYALQANANRAWVHMAAGETDVAIRILNELAERYPESTIPSRYVYEVFESAEQYERVLAEIARFEERWGEDEATIEAKIQALAFTGRHSEAQGLLERFTREESETSSRNAFIAFGRAAMGDMDGAFESFQKAAEQRDYWMGDLLLPRNAKLLGDDPRYWELVEQLNFPPLPPEHPACEQQQRYLINKRAEELIAERGLVPAEQN